MTQSRHSVRRLTALMMLAELLALLSCLVYSAQLHRLQDLWQLSNAEAGLISSAYFIGYAVAVPFLASWTDTVEPKRIFTGGAVCLAAGLTGFGFFADGFVSGAIFQAIAGVGLAGSYMPGLKGLLDHVPPEQHSRVNAVYASGFGLGTALSFPFAVFVGEWLGWQSAFYGAAIAALLAAALVWAYLPPSPAGKLSDEPRRMRDFLPVLRNRSALAYGIGYGLHCWELFALRSWVIAFLVYAAAQDGGAPGWFAPAIVAASLTMIGVPCYFAGNELAIRFGRQRVVTAVMILSALVCATTGATPAVFLWPRCFRLPGTRHDGGGGLYRAHGGRIGQCHPRPERGDHGRTFHDRVYRRPDGAADVWLGLGSGRRADGVWLVARLCPSERRAAARALGVGLFETRPDPRGYGLKGGATGFRAIAERRWQPWRD